MSWYPVTTTKCKLCGIEFPIKPSRLKRAKLNFCSDACLRKKNTLVGWIVRCNRKFQKRCTPKLVRVTSSSLSQWDVAIQRIVAKDWIGIHKRKLTVESRWNAKIASMYGANRYREDSRRISSKKHERTNARRDAEIFLMHQSGFTKKEIAGAYAMSCDRIKEILQQERFERGMRDGLPPKKMSHSWEKTLGRLKRTPKEVDAWYVTLNAMQSNHRKRIKKKAILQLALFAKSSKHRDTNVHCPATS